MGDCIAELLELLKKWAIEVKLPSVVLGIPPVLEPLTDVVYREGSLCRVHGDHCASRHVALTVIQIPFVAETKPALPPADAAEGRWGNILFLPANDWRDLAIVRQVFLRDFECGRTLEAGAIHE